MDVGYSELLDNYVRHSPLESLRARCNVHDNEEAIQKAFGDFQAPKGFPALARFFKQVWKRCIRLCLPDREKIVVLACASRGTDVAGGVSHFLADCRSIWMKPDEDMGQLLRLLGILNRCDLRYENKVETRSAYRMRTREGSKHGGESQSEICSSDKFLDLPQQKRNA